MWNHGLNNSIDTYRVPTPIIIDGTCLDNGVNAHVERISINEMNEEVDRVKQFIQNFETKLKSLTPVYNTIPISLRNFNRSVDYCAINRNLTNINTIEDVVPSSSMTRNSNMEILDLTSPINMIRNRKVNQNRNVDHRIVDYVDLCSPIRNTNSQQSSRFLEDIEMIGNRPLQSITCLDSNFTHRRHTVSNAVPQEEVLTIYGDEEPIIPNNMISTPSKKIKTENFQCAVCMDCPMNRKPTTTKCGHVFCYSCITRAIQVSKKCPMCNTKLRMNHLLRLYI